MENEGTPESLLALLEAGLIDREECRKRALDFENRAAMRRFFNNFNESAYFDGSEPETDSDNEEDALNDPDNRYERRALPGQKNIGCKEIARAEDNPDKKEKVKPCFSRVERRVGFCPSFSCDLCNKDMFDQEEIYICLHETCQCNYGVCVTCWQLQKVGELLSRENAPLDNPVISTDDQLDEEEYYCDGTEPHTLLIPRYTHKLMGNTFHTHPLFHCENTYHSAMFELLSQHEDQSVPDLWTRSLKTGLRVCRHPLTSSCVDVTMSPRGAKQVKKKSILDGQAAPLGEKRPIDLPENELDGPLLPLEQVEKDTFIFLLWNAMIQQVRWICEDIPKPKMKKILLSLPRRMRVKGTNFDVDEYM